MGGSLWTWPALVERALPPPTHDREAMVEVVMGKGAEVTGAPPASPAPPPPPAAKEAPQQAPPPAPAPEPQTETPPAPPAEATPPAPPPPPPPEPKPAAAQWQPNVLPGEGLVGAAEVIGERLRPAVGARGNIPPGYPPQSGQLGEQGVVGVHMHVGRNGAVTEADVVQTSGYPRLDEAARSALAQWHFTPAMQNGRPVESDEEIQVRFRLD